MAGKAASSKSIWPLRGRVQKYAWGKIGEASAVAQLYHSETKTPINTTDPYAELWWGTHKTAPTDVLLETDEPVPLATIIESDPQLVLGSKVAQKFSNQLPFLLKVLSINKALSIQAHPDETLAKKLHATFPEHYADPNHKPEIAIALTPFNAMCGFRPESEIVENIKSTPELAAILGKAGQDLIQSFSKANLRTAYQALLTADSDLVKTELDKLIQRTQDQTDLVSESVRQIARDFPGDVGLFCLFLFNVVTLQPGEALFLAPNEPHAYFKGDCVECMACSDNVVRAGLTPKFKHVDTLVPIPEFEVSVFQLDPSSGSHELTLPKSSGPSIIIMVEGSGRLSEVIDSGKTDLSLTKGSAAFVYANVDCRLTADPTSPKILMFRATTNCNIFS